MFLFRVGLADLIVTALVSVLLSSSVFAQTNDGEIRGTVTFATSGEPVHGATVLVVGGNVVVTGDNGEFLLEMVPVGTHAILAQREHLTAER